MVCIETSTLNTKVQFLEREGGIWVQLGRGGLTEFRDATNGLWIITGRKRGRCSKRVTMLTVECEGQSCGHSEE